MRLAALSDRYIELFPEFAKESCKAYWMECIGAYPVDGETAEALYTQLTEGYMSRLYGLAAIDAYAENPSAMAFDCYFENGIAKLTINGPVISGEDAEGNERFRHAYAWREDVPVTFMGEELGVSLHVYETPDEDAGAFRYFAFSDDTLGETQHIEFRYAADLQGLGSYSDGALAYWMASGTQDGYSEKMINACIQLFVDENVGEMFPQAPEN